MNSKGASGYRSVAADLEVFACWVWERVVAFEVSVLGWDREGMRRAELGFWVIFEVGFVICLKT